MLSAIVIIPESREEETCGGASSTTEVAGTKAQQELPLACVEVLGRSAIGELIEELLRSDVATISVCGNACAAPVGVGADFVSRIEFHSAEEAWTRATQQLPANNESDADVILVARVGAYVDLDLKDALQSHREQGQAVTRAFDAEGPLDIWMIDPAVINGDVDVLTALSTVEPARYGARGYVNRLEHPADLRRLVMDGLSSRCRLRPRGTEIRSGVWLDEGAEVHQDARIVAPAFIGRRTKIGEQCLITRSSNVESNCEVDYGTVVEDSSILSNSYVGIGLDVSHSIVDGNKLFNLEHRVALEMADPCVIRRNEVLRQSRDLQPSTAFGLGGVQFT